MLRYYCLVLIFFVSFSSSTAHAEAAISIGDNYRGGTAWAAAANRSSRNDAIQDSLARCAKYSNSCHLAAQFHSLCYAIAEFKAGGVVWATAADSYQAHNKALAECINVNLSCDVVASECDTISEDALVAQAEAQQATPLEGTLEEHQRRADPRPLAVPLPNQAPKPQLDSPIPVKTAEAQPLEPAPATNEYAPPIERMRTFLKRFSREIWALLAIVVALALVPTLTDKPAALLSTAIVPIDNKIYLKLRRSQRTSFFLQRPIFMLDARADVSLDTRILINRHQLNRLVIYDSKARTANAEQALAHFNEAANVSYNSGASAIAKAWWKNARGAVAGVKMALSLRVTVDKLLAGQHIECRDLNELIGAENALVQACQTLRTYIEVSATFDGREDLLEF